MGNLIGLKACRHRVHAPWSFFLTVFPFDLSKIIESWRCQSALLAGHGFYERIVLNYM